MPVVETLRSFVNTWECDENDHLNVQFYFAKFEEADRQFRFFSGLSDTLAGVRLVRHVRFHSELHVAALLKVESHVSFAGPHALSVVHLLRDASSGRLAATALDGYAPSTRAATGLQARLAPFEAEVAEQALPRNFPAERQNLTPVAGDLEQAGAQLTNRATAMPRDCGVDGRVEDRFLLACFTDGVPHLWERTPMTRAWLEKHDYGRVALEMKLTRSAALLPGRPVHVLSGFLGVADKTFSFRHHMFDSTSGQLLAILDVTALAMNLDTRRAVPLPEGAKTAIADMVLR